MGIETSNDDVFTPQLIVHLKLINGDEIIGEFLGETQKGQYLIKDPLIVQEQVDIMTGNIGLVLNKYVWFETKSEVLFKKLHVLSVVPIFNELVELYQNSLEYNNSHVNTLLKNVTNASSKLKYELNPKGTSNSSFINFDGKINHPGTDTLN